MGDFLELLGSLGGIGTELGLANLLFLVCLFVAGWFVKREVKSITTKVNEMWSDYTYRKRRNSTGKHEMPDKKLLAKMVNEIMKEKE